MPVAIASDQSDVPVALKDGSGNALTSATRGSEQALSAQIVDAAGAQITTFGADPVGIKDTGATPIDPATKQQLPATLGAKTGANSLSVIEASDSNLTNLSFTAGKLYIQDGSGDLYSIKDYMAN